MTLNCGPFEACRTLPRHQQSPTYGPAAGYLQCKLQKKPQCHSIHYQSIHHRFCVFSLKKHLKFKHNGSVDIVLMYSVLSEQRRDIYVLSSFQLVLLCMFRRSIYVYVFIRLCRIPTVYMYVLNPLF